MAQDILVSQHHKEKLIVMVRVKFHLLFKLFMTDVNTVDY